MEYFIGFIVFCMWLFFKVWNVNTTSTFATWDQYLEELGESYTQKDYEQWSHSLRMFLASRNVKISCLG